MTEPFPTYKLAYLATPCSKYLDGIDAAFAHAAKLAARLLARGLKIYSPIAHTYPLATYGVLDPYDMRIWRPLNETMLAACQVLIVAHIDGWEESSGMAHEIERATQWRMPIYDLDVETFELTLRTPPKPERTRHQLDPEQVKQLDNSARDQWLNPEM